MNITLLAKKGGVGKSTVSVLLHKAIRLTGKSVAIRDWDAQGTTSKALKAIGVEDSGQKKQASLFATRLPTSNIRRQPQQHVRHLSYYNIKDVMF